MFTFLTIVLVQYEKIQYHLGGFITISGLLQTTWRTLNLLNLSNREGALGLIQCTTVPN